MSAENDSPKKSSTDIEDKSELKPTGNAAIDKLCERLIALKKDGKKTIKKEVDGEITSVPKVCLKFKKIN